MRAHTLCVPSRIKRDSVEFEDSTVIDLTRQGIEPFKTREKA
jgi:hypothetical protein